ncbi:hypothetical protein P9112_005332 [Eukaryota sp. TZLM1-RC]
MSVESLFHILAIMQVFVRLLTGKTITLVVLPPADVRSLKQQVYEKSEIPIEQQRMVYAGKTLQDDRYLADYDIRNESTIDLLVRLRGGWL